MSKKADIISYWENHQDECGLSVDWAEADKRSWRCGCERSLQRCHIIPDSLGGKDTPENFVLLCKRCHEEVPNVTDSEIMWDWLRAYGCPLYDTFWVCEGIREYKFIYKHSFWNALKYIKDHSKIKKGRDEIMNCIQEEIKNTSSNLGFHFGQNYWNTATYAGKFRMLIKSFAEQMGVNIKKMDQEILEDKGAWWL